MNSEPSKVRLKCDSASSLAHGNSFHLRDFTKPKQSLSSATKLFTRFPELEVDRPVVFSASKSSCITFAQREFLTKFNQFVREKIQPRTQVELQTLVSQHLENEAELEFGLIIAELKRLGDISNPLLIEINQISASGSSRLFKTKLRFSRVIEKTNTSEAASSNQHFEKIATRLTKTFRSHKKRIEYEKSIRSLIERISNYRQSQLLNTDFIDTISKNRVGLVHLERNSEIVPVPFYGVFSGSLAPDGIDSSLWPSGLWRRYAWDELRRSYLGGDTNVFQRGSMTLEGNPPIQITDLFEKDAKGDIRVAPDEFFSKAILALLNWMEPTWSIDDRASARIIKKIKSFTGTEFHPFEHELATKQLKQDQNVTITDQEINDFVYLRRVNRLAKRFPVISLLSSATINAAVGLPSVKVKYLPELFASGHEKEHGHLYCSQVDHDYRTNLSFERESSNQGSAYWANQLTKYKITAHPNRVEDKTYGPTIATFDAVWGVRTTTTKLKESMQYMYKVNKEPIQYMFKIKNLSFTQEASLEDLQLVPFLFRQAQYRYTDERMGLSKDSAQAAAPSSSSNAS